MHYYTNTTTQCFPSIPHLSPTKPNTIKTVPFFFSISYCHSLTQRTSQKNNLLYPYLWEKTPRVFLLSKYYRLLGKNMYHHFLNIVKQALNAWCQCLFFPIPRDTCFTGSQYSIFIHKSASPFTTESISTPLLGLLLHTTLLTQ